jgi:hypothetical protein
VNIKLAQHLFGYQSDKAVASAWSLSLKALFIVGMIAVGASMAAFAYGERLSRRGNIEILSTLDEFTRDAGPAAPNTIPAFLELPGHIGLLGPSADLSEPVRALVVADLQEGFCSTSLARQIRHQYPGYYDSWPDEKLQGLALDKYPEMRDRVCALSYKIDATPVGVIKYQLKPRTIGEHAGLLLLILVVTGGFAIACLNLYYRVLVDRLPWDPLELGQPLRP